MARVCSTLRPEWQEARYDGCRFMRKKKQEKTNIHIFKRQGKGDGRTARRHHTGILRRGVWCSSRRPPLGVCLFLSLLAVSRQFSPRSSMPPRGLVLTLVVLSPAVSSSRVTHRSPRPRSATPPLPLPIPCARGFPASRRSSALLAAYCGPSSLSSSPREHCCALHAPWLAPARAGAPG